MKNRNVLISGGSGHIGKPLVSALLDRGARVFNMSSRKSGIQHSSLFEYCVDLEEDGEAADAFKWLGNTMVGGLDGIVCLASRASKGIRISMSGNQFMEEMRESIKPVVNVISNSISLLNSESSIVLTGSAWGKLSPRPEVYLDLNNEPSLALVAAKAATEQYGKYLSVLLASKKIRVNILTPGWFPAKRGPQRDDYISSICRNVPMGRIGLPDELVMGYLYLLGTGASYVTGQTLVIDGGYSAI